MIDKQKQMIEEFQCPGCVAGSDTNCEEFKVEEENKIEEERTFKCVNHCPGTRILGLGRIYLGMPKGFNRVGNTINASAISDEDRKPSNILKLCWLYNHYV